MTTWEYKMIGIETTGFTGGKFDYGKFEDELNKLGQDGWELVNTFDTNQVQGQSRDVIAVLKRSTS